MLRYKTSNTHKSPRNLHNKYYAKKVKKNKSSQLEAQATFIYIIIIIIIFYT